jgi:hypothetical protein
MSGWVEYHMGMRPPISLRVAFLSAFAALLFLVSTSYAQINGSPSSVTSPGFGGRAINGTPASVTSLSPRGYEPGPRIPLASAANGFHRGEGHRHHHRRQDGEYGAPLMYAVPVPYAVGDSGVDEDAADDDANYQGGPTVFDRRGQGAESYVPPVENAPPAHAAQADDPPAEPEPAPVPTMLVFKDRHKLEVGNYAIVGPTLFDLTPGHARRVPLADLDLAATTKANDDRGVVFQLPSSPQAN